jgi:hypothetical protein
MGTGFLASRAAELSDIFRSWAMRADARRHLIVMWVALRPHRRPAAHRRARRPRRPRLHRPGPRPRRPGHHHRLQGHPDPQNHPRPAPGQPDPVRRPRPRRARLQRPQALADPHPAPHRPLQGHHLAARPARPHPPAHHPLTDDHELRPHAPTSTSTANPVHTSPADQLIQVGTTSLASLSVLLGRRRWESERVRSCRRSRIPG